MSLTPTPTTTATRHAQILDAAAACFAHRGFHQATMQDICAEAGLSPGSVYRYYRSKDDLIAALVERDRAEGVALIAAARGVPDLATALGDLVAAALAALDDPHACALYVEIGAEAVRNPRVGDLVRRHTESLVAALSEVLTEAGERGLLAPALEPPAVARMLLALIDGLISQRSLDPSLDTRAQVALVRTLLARLLP